MNNGENGTALPLEIIFWASSHLIVLRTYVIAELRKTTSALAAVFVRNDLMGFISDFFTSPEYKYFVVILASIGGIVCIAFIVILTLTALRQLKDKR